MTDTKYKLIIANHIGTWKYTFLMVSFNIGSTGTGPINPPITEADTKTAAKIFHQFFLILNEFFNLAKGTEITTKKL